MDGSLTISRSAAPVREEVVRVLRAAIVDGRFQPGSRLSERELCAAIGASRTTVREAVRQLETEGFVRSVPGKGLEITQVTAEDVRDLFEIRAVLEGLAARLFAQRADDAAKRRLRAIFEDLLDSYGSGDIPSIIVKKDAFYEVLFSGAGNQLLQGFIGTLHGRIRRLRSASLSAPNRPKASAEELRGIIEAIESGDAQRAEQDSIAHVHNAARGALHTLGAESP